MSALAKRTATSSTDKDERGTPQKFFDALHAKWNFTVDVCATHEKAKLPRYFTKVDDGLAQSWQGEVVWCNPPYSDIRPWLEKALREDVPCVFLLPATTDVRWFHDLVLPNFQIEFVRGRLKFEGFEQGANFGSLLAYRHAAPEK